jgi:tRNA modification GTPase
MMNDTIVAISTPIGQGAIGIVRLSGDDAISIVQHSFEGPDLHQVPSHSVQYGHIVDGTERLDEVLVTVFRSPRSFTTEDVVEIHCHGGMFVTGKILERMLISGARAARPGEFTERAFLHGRIDLTQAESVMDLIDASSDLALSLANKGLDGVVFELITSLRSDLLDIIATIEVNIDYPEYDDVETLTNDVLQPAIVALKQRIAKVLERSRFGRVIRDGVKTAIIGRPNVGKSSLLNALLREDKAIVTEVQGTTRDIVEGRLNIGGIVLHLIDTAGIRESEDVVERIGIDKARRVIDEAELILYVLDNNQPLTEEDNTLLDATKDKQRIVIINKTDLSTALRHEFDDAVAISALHRHGIDALEERIRGMFLSGQVRLGDEAVVANARHIALLESTQQALDDSLASIGDDMPVDMVEIDLKNAWMRLGEIIGETSSDSLLDQLFSKFCLGK